MKQIAIPNSLPKFGPRARGANPLLPFSFSQNATPASHCPTAIRRESRPETASGHLPRRLAQFTFLLVVALLNTVVPAQADGPEEVRAKRLREQLPAIDFDKLEEALGKGLKGNDGELAYARETVERVREKILKKWF